MLESVSHLTERPLYLRSTRDNEISNILTLRKQCRI